MGFAGFQPELRPAPTLVEICVWRHSQRDLKMQLASYGTTLNMRLLVPGRAKLDFKVNTQHSPSHWVVRVFLVVLKTANPLELMAEKSADIGKECGL